MPTLSHGLSRTPEYRAWQTMRHRCTSPTSPAWSDYGGRGIRIADEWVNDPAAFIAHVGPRPSPKHEIDREDNDGHYEPGNVRWVTRKINDRNRRSSRFVELSVREGDGQGDGDFDDKATKEKGCMSWWRCSCGVNVGRCEDHEPAEPMAKLRAEHRCADRRAS